MSRCLNCEFYVNILLTAQVVNNTIFTVSFRFDGFLFREEVVIVSKKRNKSKKSYISRKLQSRRSKTDWIFWFELLQSAIAIYHVLFD